MSKSPRTSEFRVKVSQEYLDELGSYNYWQLNIHTKYPVKWKKELFCKKMKQYVVFLQLYIDKMSFARLNNTKLYLISAVLQ